MLLLYYVREQTVGKAINSRFNNAINYYCSFFTPSPGDDDDLAQ
jgi:hypothetical protein